MIRLLVINNVYNALQEITRWINRGLANNHLDAEM